MAENQRQTCVTLTVKQDKIKCTLLIPIWGGNVLQEHKTKQGSKGRGDKLEIVQAHFKATQLSVASRCRTCVTLLPNILK